MSLDQKLSVPSLRVVESTAQRLNEPSFRTGLAHYIRASFSGTGFVGNPVCVYIYLPLCRPITLRAREDMGD